VALAALLLISACAQLSEPPVTAAKPNVNLAGYPPAFRAGYADGCTSVRQSALKRDAARFKSDANYAQGWHDGHDICARR
jgi:hypothetical protein